MQNLEKRIAALEKAMPTTEGLTIVRTIVSPGHLDAEIDHIRDDYGNEWTRRPEETEDAFTERATAETTANAYGVKSLVASNSELHHAGH
jgi:hypothetical protein